MYALVHYPNIDTRLINEFRGKYDPHFDLIEPHVTLVFLVPESIGEANLVGHIEEVLRQWQPFSIHLQGLQKAWDPWLFLILAEGNDSVIRLHRELYTGPLASYRREDLEFVPHLGLGLFAQRDAGYDIRDPQEVPLDVEKYSQALSEAQQLGLDFRCIVDRLHLVKLSADISRIVWSKEFPLLG